MSSSDSIQHIYLDMRQRGKVAEAVDRLRDYHGSKGFILDLKDIGFNDREARDYLRLIESIDAY